MRRVAVVGPCLLALACGGKSRGSDDAPEPEAEAPGSRVYVINFDSHDISGFDVDDSGRLTELPGSPYESEWGPTQAVASPDQRHLYVSTSDRIQTYSISASSGALSLVDGSAKNVSTYALTIAPSGKVLYAGDCLEPEGTGAVSMIAVEAGVARNEVTSLRTSTCVNDLAPAPSGKFLYTTSQYGSRGALEGYAVDEEAGELKPLPGSPFASFITTAVAISPRGDRLYVADQDGLVRAYQVDPETGAFTAPSTATATGANPFSVIINHSGTRLLVGNWSGNGISSYRLDASPERAPVEVPGSPFLLLEAPHLFGFDATGRFVYANSQPVNALDVFELDDSGALKPIHSAPVGAGPIAAVPVP